MTLYFVQVRGEPIRFRLNERWETGGFYRNVFILARNPHDAAISARTKVWSDLKAKAEIECSSLTASSLQIEEIAKSFAIWKLLFSQGFIFYSACS